MSSPYTPTDLTQSDQALVDWSAPAGIVEQAEKAATEPPHAELRPTATDVLRQDANPSAYPDGAPELRSYLRLPFRERARFMQRLEPLQPKIEAMPRKDTNVSLGAAADMYNTLAEIDDVMREVAVDPVAYDAWVAQASDAEFSALFNAFFAGSQPGEAVSSSS